MKNKYLEIQYKLHIRNIELFLAAIKEAARKEDKIIDREEAKQIKAIERKCIRLKKQLQKYTESGVPSK